MNGNRVLLLNHSSIMSAGISASQCMEWIEDSFRLKYDATLPPKISLHPQGDDFFNTMPCLLPQSWGRFAVKEVHRIAGSQPALGSDILLYDSNTGHLLAIIDGDWITNMRTGAVAALASRMFKASGVNTYSFIGLGNTARATALCLLADAGDAPITFRLLAYKDQADDFAARFKDYSNLTIEVVNSADELVAGAQVLISCITAADGLICPADELYSPGMTLIPVHTRGFQNCDLFFDKVYGDDTGHIKGFKYFDRFKRFAELSQVLLGTVRGRESDDERILCYNIGLGLHDAVFASRLYDLLAPTTTTSFFQDKPTAKFWI